PVAISAPFPLLFHCYRHHPAPHSFPTRRSSDLRPRMGERSASIGPGTLRRRVVDGLRLTFLDPMQRALTIPRAMLDFFDAYSLSDRKSTRLNSSHRTISYAVFCLKKKIEINKSN